MDSATQDASLPLPGLLLAPSRVSKPAGREGASLATYAHHARPTVSSSEQSAAQRSPACLASSSSSSASCSLPRPPPTLAPSSGSARSSRRSSFAANHASRGKLRVTVRGDATASHPVAAAAASSGPSASAAGPDNALSVWTTEATMALKRACVGSSMAREAAGCRGTGLVAAAAGSSRSGSHGLNGACIAAAASAASAFAPAAARAANASCSTGGGVRADIDWGGGKTGRGSAIALFSGFGEAVGGTAA